MDFDRYGIEEWASARPQILAQRSLDARADAALLRAMIKRLVGWRIRREKADTSAEMLAATEV